MRSEIAVPWRCRLIDEQERQEPRFLCAQGFQSLHAPKDSGLGCYSFRNDHADGCSRAIGASKGRILANHIMRSIWSPVIVIASLQVSNAILLEATLSFFGLGVSTPTASWGFMISVGRSYLMIAPWLSLFPGFFILITVLSLNLLGDGLRDALDPRLG